MARTATAPLAATSATASANTAAVAPSSSMQSFSRSIKKDPESYPTFKEAKFWDAWNRELKVKAKLHGLLNVLDANYQPSTLEETELFDMHKTFLYSVFLSKVTAPDGINLVKTNLDAQACYQALVKRFETGAEATMDAQTIRTKILALKLDKSWRSTATKFINHYESQVILLESLTVDKDLLWHEKSKMTMVESAVRGNAQLASIMSQELLDVAKGRDPMTYVQYISLLKTKAHEIDSQDPTPGSSGSRGGSRNNAIHQADGRGGGRGGRGGRKGDRGGRGSGRGGSGRSGRGVSQVEKSLFDQLPSDVKSLISKARREGTETDESAPSSTQIHTNQAESTTPAPATVSTAAVGIMQAATQRAPAAGTDIRSVLAASRGSTGASRGEYCVDDKGQIFISLNSLRQYRVNEQATSVVTGSLMDNGANGGMAGDDVKILAYHDHDRAHVTGIAGNTLEDLPIVTAAGLIETTNGPVIGIFHQYAYHGKGKTIHSVPQIQHFDLHVDCTSRKRHGKQRVVTPDGWIIPLHVRNGLTYMDMRPPDDSEIESYPHVMFTSDSTWDPSVLDDETDLAVPNDNLVVDDFEQEFFFDARAACSSDTGEEAQRTIAKMLWDRREDAGEMSVLDHEDTLDYLASERFYDCYNQEVKRVEPDYKRVQKCLGLATIDTIKKTFQATTQFARNVVRLPFKMHLKSRFPANSVPRRNEPVATDTVWSDVPAIDDGSTAAQVFVGRNTYVSDVYGCKTDAEFAGILEDNIRERGAMDVLISDGAKAEISTKVVDILRMYRCGNYMSEPEHQHQNFAENRIRTLKDTSNRIMDRFGAPGYTWLLCIIYVASLLNHLANPNLDDLPPLTKMYGVTVDISAFLNFYFYQPVYYAVDNSWPSESPEKSGRWVGVAHNVGDALTYKILTDDTKKIIYRSAVRPRDDEDLVNNRLEPFGGSEIDKPVKSVIKSREYALPDVRAITFNPDELLGRTFLKQPTEDGERLRARIVRKVIEMENNKEKIKFLVSLPDQDQDEILSYNEIIDIIADQYDEEQNNPEKVWLFKAITAHEGPLSSRHPNYKGAKYNVLVQWEDGSVTREPLDIFAKDDPVSCAKYAKDNNLLDEPGWKRFRHLAKNNKKLTRMINQARLTSIRRGPVFKYGFEVPRGHTHAMKLDAENGNTLWRDSVVTELTQIQEYETFESKGKGAKVPIGYKQIRCHFVFDVKHDGRHKARYVAGGHLTDPPLESVYSGVVSLRSLRLMIFIAELNGLELYAADVGNAYLEAKTREKVCIYAGPEFRDLGLEGHLLIIVRALYGLKTSGARWHDRFADTLRGEGFEPCKADRDVWMRKNGNLYEYISVYVDDLACAMKDPAAFCELLKKKHGYKLKGDGPLKYHLGCDFGRDPDGTYYYGPYKYVDKMLDTYERLFGEQPKGFTAPLEKNDHPELDMSPEMDDKGRSIYMSLVGQCQWLITLGRFDIATAIMTLSRFRAAPREGHLKRLKRIYGYIKQYPKGAIRVRVGLPEYSQLKQENYSWTSIYGDMKEELPFDMPPPLGKPVITTTYVDANLYHDYLTGRSVTGALHLVNQTPIDWYCKRQATVETATYGSEFNAARTATEQVMDMRYTLRMLGVPVIDSYMFGDNKSVHTNSTVPHSQLNKRHNALAYHRVREAIAAGVLKFFHIDGKKNPADVLSKHCGHTEAWPHLKYLLFWRGDTSETPDKGE